MTWFLLAAASAFIFAALELLMRVLSVKTHSPRIFSLVFNLWGAVFAIMLFIAEGGSFASLASLTLSQYLWIVAAIILYGIYERSQFFARRGMDAATFSIIMKLNTVIGFFGAILVLGEPLTITKVVGVALIIGASLSLVYKNPKFTLSEAFIYTLVCAATLGSTGFVDKPASSPLPATLYSFLVWCFPLFIIAFPRVSKKEFVRELKIGGWKVALAALLNVVGYIIYIHAVTLAEASRVNPIVATYGILTVIGGIFILKERDHFWRKIAAGIVAFAGVILLK